MIKIKGNYYREEFIMKISEIEQTLDSLSFHVIISTPFESEPYKKEVISVEGKDNFSRSMIELSHRGLLSQLMPKQESKDNVNKVESNTYKNKDSEPSTRKIESIASSSRILEQTQVARAASFVSIF